MEILDIVALDQGASERKDSKTWTSLQIKNVKLL